MKILYLTPAWYGFKEIIYDGECSINGLPSFTMPLKGLIERGHEVHFVILHTEDSVPDLNIKVDWLSPELFKAFCRYELKMPGRLLSILRYRKIVKSLMRQENYDLVYAHGTSTAVVRSVVNGFKVPFAQRLYGTFLWSKIEALGYWGAIARHFIEYLSFKLPKKFLLVTNDGSRGDLVFRKIFPGGNAPYDFYYWKNGVSRFEIARDDVEFFKNQLKPGPFIFYCARFDDWKRQDRVLRIIHALKCQDIIINCYFAGPFDTLGDRYFKEIVELAEELEIANQLVFMGGVDKKTIFIMNKLAIASLSLYDVCNVTNVFHEMMSSGALIVIKDDEPVRDYIEHGHNGFLVNSDEDVIQVLVKIIESPNEYDFMRENVICASSSLTKSWAERVADEIKLIESAL